MSLLVACCGTAERWLLPRTMGINVIEGFCLSFQALFQGETAGFTDYTWALIGAVSSEGSIWRVYVFYFLPFSCCIILSVMWENSNINIVLRAVDHSRSHRYGRAVFRNCQELPPPRP